MTAPRRLAIVVSHPIQHFVHLYRALAGREDLVVKVFFCSRIGLDAYFDTEMATTIQWAGSLTAGYDHEFLPESAAIAKIGFREVNNPGISPALAAFRPDAVLLYGYAQLTQLRALAWCWWQKIPALMAGDGDNVQDRQTLRGRVRKFLLRAVLGRVAAFLTVGDQNEAMLAGLGQPGQKFFRTPFPIDEALYLGFRQRRGAERARIRRQHGIAEEAFVLLFVGKLSARKRPLDLAAACARLPGRPAGSRPVALLYCGDGLERPALAAAIARQTMQAVLAGFVNVDQLPGYYCAADVLVHPSEHDPHPLVCSEAACIGLPMILSDRVGAAGPTDIALVGQNALVYPCGDVAALARAIAQLHGDDGLCQEMAARSLVIYTHCGLEVAASAVARAVAAVTAREGVA